MTEAQGDRIIELLTEIRNTQLRGITVTYPSLLAQPLNNLQQPIACVRCGIVGPHNCSYGWNNSAITNV